MDLISILNTGFIICLSAAILFLVISIILFFVFDIRTIYMIRSGRAQARTVKEMEKANSDTGRLRIGKVTQTSTLGKDSGKQTDKLDKKTGKLSKTTGRLNKKTGKMNKKPVIQPPVKPEPLPPAADVSNEPVYTSPQPSRSLSQDPFNDQRETSVLAPETETSVLSKIDDTAYEAGVQSFYFEIIKKIIVRDTDEVIR